MPDMLQKMSRRWNSEVADGRKKQIDPKSKIEPNDHNQIVDICLIYILEGLKRQNNYKK